MVACSEVDAGVEARGSHFISVSVSVVLMTLIPTASID